MIGRQHAGALEQSRALAGRRDFAGHEERLVSQAGVELRQILSPAIVVGTQTQHDAQLGDGVFVPALRGVDHRQIVVRFERRGILRHYILKVLRRWGEVALGHRGQSLGKFLGRVDPGGRTGRALAIVRQRDGKRSDGQ